MSPERWQEVKTLFTRAAAEPPAERPAFLDRECGGDDELRAEVESLLDSDETPDSLLDGEAMMAAVGSLLDGDALLGTAGRQIGSYRLLRELGRGGMAVVYAAARADDQYEKEVAIKLIKRGLDSEPIVERFLQERQILANLDHPNIARLHDGGVTDDGSPYLVMERIEGERIDEYCDRKALDTVARLELFREVCAAVQFAHQNLVVHRDLKPSNILVTPDGTPKLLDFGIAKLLEPGDVPHAADATVLGQRPMTPDYASPEQILGRPITTASDVYSLGVVLYRLLTGHRPYHLAHHTRQEIERAICEHEPERPSTVVARPGIEPATEGGPATVTHTAAELGERRGASPERLRRTLRGDLDNVVMMEMEKSPERRYASAEQLAEDLRRYLAGLPVLARKDTPLYRASKFVRRHRLGVSAAALVVLTLVGGIVATAWQARVATRERARAEEQRRVAIDERDRARESVDVMVSLFETGETLAEETITIRELLDRGKQRIENGLVERPDIQAAVLDTVGTVYRQLALYDEAEPLLRQALAIRLEALPADHPDVATSLANLGILERSKRRGAQAEELLRRALEIRRKRLDPHDPLIAESERGLALALYEQGRFAEAEGMLRASLAWQRQALAADPETVAVTGSDLALVLQRRGQLAEAETLIHEVLEIYPARNRDRNRFVLASRKKLADILRSRGKLEEARATYQTILGQERALRGPDHPSLATTLNNLGGCLVDMGRLDEAERLMLQSIELRRASLRPDHPDVAQSLNNLSRIAFLRQDYAAAERLSREALDILYRTGDGDHPDVAITLNNLAASQQRQGDLTSATETYRKVLEIHLALFGEEHQDVAINLNNLGTVLADQGELAAAERHFRKALPIFRRILGDRHLHVANTRGNLGETLVQLGEPGPGETMLREASSLYRELLGESHPRVARCQTWLGRALMAQDRLDEAETELRRAAAIWTRSKSRSGLAITQGFLGECLWRAGRDDEAEALLLESVETLTSPAFGPSFPQRIHSIERIVRFYESRGQSDRAAPFRELLPAPSG